MIRHMFLITATLLASFAMAACSGEKQSQSTDPQPQDKIMSAAVQQGSRGVSISEARVRRPPPVAMVAAGYVTLHNTSSIDDRLVSARSPASARVEIHDMQMDDDVMRMRELPDGLAIPAGSTVTLGPGRLHLMLVEPVAGLAEFEVVSITLVFEEAGEQTVEFQMQDML